MTIADRSVMSAGNLWSNAMKFFFKVRVSNYWEDPPEISVWEHVLDDAEDYAQECLRDILMTREDWLEQIPLPARLPDHDFLIIGVGTITSTRDYWGEYDTDLDLDEIQFKSWPTDMREAAMFQLD